MTTEPGVWIVCSFDMGGAYNVVPFDDELLARRYADETGDWIKVRYVKFGEELKYT